MNFINEVVRSTFDARDYTINADTNLPTEYSCPVKVPVKNQGTKPTCVAHAAASLVEYHHKRQHNNYRAFSTEFIYGTRDIDYYIGDGMMIRNALNTIRKYGVPFKADCPGNNDVKEAMKNINEEVDHYRELAYPHRISTYYRCYTNDDIKTALVKHGPVLVSMNRYKGAKIVILPQSFTDETNKTKVVDSSKAYIFPAGREAIFNIALQGATQVKEIESNSDWSKELHTYKKFGVAAFVYNDIATYTITNLKSA